MIDPSFDTIFWWSGDAGGFQQKNQEKPHTRLMVKHKRDL